MAADSNAELMTAYLDDALEADESENFEAWLESSPEARAEVESLARMLSVVRDLPELEAPPDFYEKVSKKIRRSKFGEPGSALSLFTLPFQVVSVIVIMVIAATYLMLEIDRDSERLERDPSAAEAEDL